MTRRSRWKGRMKASIPSNTFNFSKLPPPKKERSKKRGGRGGTFQKLGTDNSIVENNDAISASCAVFTPLTKGLSPKHREGRIERSLSKLCFHHDRLDRTFVNRTVYRDTHYSNRCLSHIPPMLAFPSIPIFQSSNSPRVRKKERKEKKNFRENSRSTLVDHLDCFDLSLQREGGRVADGSVTESALNQDSRVCWAVSTSWQTPFDTRDQLPDRAAGRFFRAREGRRGRKEGGSSYTLRKSERLIVMEIVRWNETVPYGSHVIALPPTVIRWWFINNVVYLMVYRMVRWSLNRNLVGLKLWFEM